MRGSTFLDKPNSIVRSMSSVYSMCQTTASNTAKLKQQVIESLKAHLSMNGEICGWNDGLAVLPKHCWFINVGMEGALPLVLLVYLRNPLLRSCAQAFSNKVLNGTPLWQQKAVYKLTTEFAGLGCFIGSISGSTGLWTLKQALHLRYRSSSRHC